MSADVVAKKKNKSAKDATPKVTPAVDKSNGDDSHESAYVRDVQKHIRNLNKKLTATQKVDSIVAENPNLTLDELVATRKINADQKAQILNKPATQAKIVQLEEQLTQYKKFEEEHRERWDEERRELTSAHDTALESAKRAAKAEALEEAQSGSKERLLILSKFLRAAAARRQMDEENTDESKAFEGVLLLLYGGDAVAVDAAEKLIVGSSDAVPSVEGTALSVNYGRVKQLSIEYAPFAAEEAWANDVAAADSAQPLDSSSGQQLTDRIVATDPTVAHASLTEIQAEQNNTNNITSTNTTQADTSEIDLGAANAAAANQWDSSADMTASVGDDWVSIPRDAAQAEASVQPLSSATTWADEPAEALTERDLASANDGFHEVHHGRGRAGRGGGGGSSDRGGGRGRGAYSMRGPRGAGFRGGRPGGGEGAPRGRGGYRGGRGREGS